MLTSITNARPTFTPMPIVGPDLGSEVPAGAEALLPPLAVGAGVAQLGTTIHNCWDPRGWSNPARQALPTPIVCWFPDHVQLPDPSAPIQ